MAAECEAKHKAFMKAVKILTSEVASNGEESKESLVEGLHNLRRAYSAFQSSSVDYILALEVNKDKNTSSIAKEEILAGDTRSLRDNTLKSIKAVLWNNYAKPESDELTKGYDEAFEEVKVLSANPASRRDRSNHGHNLDELLSAMRKWLNGWGQDLLKEEKERLANRLQKLEREKRKLMEDWAYLRERPEEQVGMVVVEADALPDAGEEEHDLLDTGEASLQQPANPLAGSIPESPQANSDPANGNSDHGSIPPGHLSQLFVSTPRSQQANDNSDQGPIPPGHLNQLFVSTPNASANLLRGGWQGAKPKFKVAPMALPKFSGNRRDYWRWRKKWEILQGMAEPSGNPDCKLVHLLDSLDDVVKKESGVNRFNDAQEIFRVLDSKYGVKKITALAIIQELENLPSVRNNQPRQTIDLIHAVENALYDLKELEMEDVIKNQMTTFTIERKLPNTIRERWLLYEQDRVNGVTPETYFDRLLSFLKGQEDVLERMAEIDMSSSSFEKPSRSEESPGSKKGGKKAYTRATASEMKGPKQESCIMCGDVENHGKRLFRCEAFKKASLKDRRALLKKTKVCSKCLSSHEIDKSCNPRFCCSKEGCKSEDGPADHHYLLCPKPPVSKDTSRAVNKKRPQGLTEEQEGVIRGLNLTSEQEDKMRKAFTNKATSTACSGTGLQEKEHPVLMMLVDVATRGGDYVGALIDLASDTNYITHRAAKRLGLVGEPVRLIVYGVGSMVTKVETKRYLLTIKARTPHRTLRFYEMICYGLDDIASVGEVVSSERLEKFFPDVESGELARPEEIELLISAREGRLAPQRLQRIGDLVLWDGPLGKTVSGVHPDLYENVVVTIQQSKTSFARSMRTVAVRVKEELLTKDLQQANQMEVRKTALTNKEVVDWLKWDSIGAACEPVCGGCRCGQCPPGGKEMSLADERELEIIKAGLTFREKDAHSGESHWDAKYPWKEDPASLPYNRKAVEATFRRTEKRLDQDPTWKEAYAKQIHEMIERGAAVKLTEAMMREWPGAVWWVSHLAAPNPHSVTTPVRIVWDSSQVFKGVSLNNILLKGPDVLNPIRAVLLRFREGEHAAIGDVKKMYNSVWLEEQEMHVHRFLWRDSPQDMIEDYAVVRVNMGDKPAGCIAQVAMRETAKLPQFANLVEERKVIEENCYVDDILVSHNNPDRLNDILKSVEAILKVGGFHLKPWVRSGKSGRSPATAESKPVTLVLPNQLKEEDSKALGVGYLVEDDKLFVMASINFSKRRKKMRTECDLTEREVMEKTPDPLTRRILLSQVAGLYDPLGLVTPLKQKGVILVRQAFQEAGKLTKETWDEPLSAELRWKAMNLFAEYTRLSEVKFHRSITPSGWKDKPWGITFSDGSCDSYGAVLYLRWETPEGVVCRLVESKAKLTPVDQKGDPVKAEICGAVFATRLKGYMLKHGRLEIDKWYHFVDSQTVLGAIQKESYGFQTFFANRVGEIQKAGPVTDWWWIAGANNIADVITRGCAPEFLEEGSRWQAGPHFLSTPVENWPMKSASEVAAAAREAVGKLQRKAFTAVTTRAQAKKTSPPTNPVEEKAGDAVPKTPDLTTSTVESNRNPIKLWGAPLVGLVNLKKYSSLNKLVSVIGYVRRALSVWSPRGTKPPASSKWEVLSVAERKTAFRELCLAAQKGVEFPTTTINRLVVHTEESSGLLLCHGRVQTLNKESTGVPLLPYKHWVSTLLTEQAHRANHEGVAGTLLRVREKAWIIQGPRIARNVIDSCLHCRKTRAKMCQQVMSVLPPERTTPAAPFEYTTLDLFGPYSIRDAVRKRTSKKAWGVVFSCMASRAIHADVVEDLSTEGFLKTFHRFTALRGHPRKLWSDSGTNFVGAKPALEELSEYLANIDKDKVQTKAAEAGTDWAWTFHPADSPHRNGAAEAAVRVVKRALSSVGLEGNLTALEFQTLLYLAANLSNERPIGARAQLQDETIEVISPNSLLLGRTGYSGDPKGFEFASYPFVRLRAIQIEVDKFWKRWSQLAGPGLFVRQKWHLPSRNLAVGDIVWLADQNALRGRFKLGRVEEVHPDNKGVVRDVKVKTCLGIPASASYTKHNRETGNYPTTTLHRDVRRLVVILPVEEQK